MSNSGQQDKFRDRAESWDPEAREEPWKPDEGGLLVGTVVDRDDDRSTDYGTCTVLNVESEDDGVVYAVWCFYQVLRNEVERQNPQIGERVAIKRLTNGPAPNGKQAYRRYKLAIDRPAHQPVAASPAVTPRGVTAEQFYGPPAPKGEESESTNPPDPEDRDLPF